jgi:hypothetical protein
MPSELQATEAKAWQAIVAELFRIGVYDDRNRPFYVKAAQIVAARGASKASHDALRECHIGATGRALVLLVDHPKRERIFEWVAAAYHFGQREAALRALRAFGLTLSDDEIDPDVLPLVSVEA